MVHEIVTYPDKRLKERSKEVFVFDEKLHQLLDDMYETMLAKKGVGLAAIQIGVPLRVIIINLPDENGEQKREDLIEAINPEILKKDGEIKFKEGCLSVPEFYSDVDRAESIEVEFYDRFGNKKRVNAVGYLAVAFQHEIDHLNGQLFIDRISILKRKKFEKEFKKSLKEKPKL